MDNLTLIANKYGTDKGSLNYEAHNYTPIYDKYMSKLREKPIRLLEIGVNDPRFPQASLRVWAEYFHIEGTRIYGVDINTEGILPFDARVNVMYGDCTSPVSMKQIGKYYAPFDFVIDDGPHTFLSHLVSFFGIFPYLSQDGVYFIEDLHAYDSHKTIEFFKTFYGSLNCAVSLEAKDKLLCITKI